MDRSLVVRIARASAAEVSGTFQRHVSPKVRSITGTVGGGRWGFPGTYPVLYLGRPRDSIVIEAYRHLVDDVEGMTAAMVGPRRLLTCEVAISNVLDLRDEKAREVVGITVSELIGPWGPCQEIGQAAHQLGLHGVIAPAATQVGETLAVFEHNVPHSELPQLVDDEVWAHLPPDPRVLRIVGNEA